jgi:pyridoxal phosphate enzyme (YggS family)
MITYDEFAARAATVRQRIDDACRAAGRAPGEVELLAVTKTHPAAAVEYAARLGLRAVGENRVQEAAAKRPLCRAEIQWELIGHLQSNKAKVAAEYFDRVQSADSVKLLTLLDRAAGERGRTLAVLLQINAGHDPAKFGAEPEDAPHLLEHALSLKQLRVDGLMTIAPLSDDPSVATRTFENLRTIRDNLAARFGTPLRELSMGMSGDLEEAVRAGSTLVRIGTALYGARE